tara:strand:- start:13532 stop:14077 length:546 start_codon:yes stop_codon:yes gene_type:complete
MLVQTIKDITICLLLSIISSFSLYLVVCCTGSLELWLIFLLGFLLSVIHLITAQSENTLVRFSKLAMPLITLFIVSYMVYVEFNYPTTEELMAMSNFERGLTFISQLDKETIMNFVSRFFQVVSLKFLIGLYAFYALGSFIIKHFKFEGYTQQLFSEQPSDDGNIVKKHLKRKSTKFKRRF